MQTRRFGRTGHMSTIIIFGAFAVGMLDQEEADDVMELLLDHGVNHIDVAPSYADSEERLGPWLEAHRDQFFLGCKTQLRGKDEAREELHCSLERLRVDRFDPRLDLANLLIQDPSCNRLNKVKKTSPEAFYYFYLACTTTATGS